MLWLEVTLPRSDHFLQIQPRLDLRKKLIKSGALYNQDIQNTYIKNDEKKYLESVFYLRSEDILKREINPRASTVFSSSSSFLKAWLPSAVEEFNWVEDLLRINYQ